MWLQLQEEKGEVEWEAGEVKQGEGKVTSDPIYRQADSVISAAPAVTFIHISKRMEGWGEKREGRNNEASPGGDEMEAGEEEEETRDKGDK